MKIIGIIAEYNPFHNGHLYHINKIKEMYPDSLLILILNGYFLMRGEISFLSKEDKTKIALQHNIDLVIEHPFYFASNSADIFALSAIYLLDKLGCEMLIFGSESNDIKKLDEIANKQLDENNFNQRLKKHLNAGINYPTALSKALEIELNTPNDLLGVSYIKAIKKINSKIVPLTIQRTNNYHDTISNDEIISASNIREKIKMKKDINKYLPKNVIAKIQIPDDKLLFNLVKYQVMTNENLKNILSVDEGIESRIIKYINEVNNLDELILKIKSKRYTYNRIKRMLIHILFNFKKEEKSLYTYPTYIKILGFNNLGQKYLNDIKKKIDIKIGSKIDNNPIKDLELRSAFIYEMITGNKSLLFEKSNKPIKKEDI